MTNGHDLIKCNKCDGEIMHIYNDGKIIMTSPCDCKKDSTIKKVKQTLDEAYEAIKKICDAKK